MKKVYLLCLSALIATAAIAQQTMKIRINAPKKQTEIGATATTSKFQGISQLAGTISCNTAYVSDTTMDLNFNLLLTNTDLEYGDLLTITFPAGMTPLLSPTDPIGPDDGGAGSDGPEAYNGVSGQDISWGNDDNNYGGIVPGMPYPFVISVAIDSGLAGLQIFTAILRMAIRTPSEQLTQRHSRVIQRAAEDSRMQITRRSVQNDLHRENTTQRVGQRRQLDARQPVV